MHGEFATLLLSCSVIALTAVSIAESPKSTPKAQNLLPRYDIPRLRNIVIDGQGDDWGDAAFCVDLLTPVDGKIWPADEHHASLRLGWDERGLLLLIDVADKDWSESPDNNQLWMRDSLELYLAPFRGASDSCQWVISPGMAADQPEARSQFYDNRQRKLRSANSMVFARSKEGNRCRLEVLLPWSMIGIEPHVGREVAFQINTNDTATGGTDLYHLSWYPALGAAFTSMKMHRLRLAETAGTPLIARLNLIADQAPEGKRFRALAPTALAGKAVALVSGEQTLAHGTLQADASGYAQAMFTVPNPVNGQAYDSVALLVENTPVDRVVLLPGQDDFPARAQALEAVVTTQHSAPGITLTWPLDADDTGKTVISRSAPGTPARKVTRTVTGNSYTDTSARAGQLYEYAIRHDGATWPATSYLYAGHEVPLEEQHGAVVLIVEQGIAVGLKEEIARLMRDLVGDGWQVIRHDVARDAAVTEVKALIMQDCKATPSVDTIFLLGHVPVPYSGKINPDGHDDHRGSWPADVYYGDLDGQWTDTQNLTPKADGRMKNVAGDGKFDQSKIPADVKLAVGRVDLSDMPAFAQSEEALLRQYLDRDHAYRHKRLTVEPNALIADSFKERSEGFSYGGWQAFTTLLRSDHVSEGEWFAQGQKSYLLMYACGPGGYTGGGGLGSTEDLVTKPVNGIFTPIFGSYFVDWDTQNNLMRALLCNAGSPLATFWSGRPHWYLHPLGMGKTIGYCARLTQNNRGEYAPTGDGARGVHIALLGDPTLRLHIVAPPANLAVDSTRHGAHLTWKPSPDSVCGYLVYHAREEFGPYQRITDKPVPSATFTDPHGAPGEWYMVRALTLQQTPTGSYYNASQGVFGQLAK